jgi:citrate lyase subunit beta/citryl-CoA lyase
MLFVPGIRESWIAKTPEYGADALILDLEDSVPPDAKDQARAIVGGQIPELAKAGQRVWVRINKSPHLYSLEDLFAVVEPGLEGVVLPKAQGPDDVAIGAAMLAEAEMRKGLAIGSVELFIILETARSLQMAYEIALHPRVAAIAGAPAKGADVARAVGFRWTREGLESLYLRSRAILAARAAGKLPLGGLWQEVHDLEGLKTFASFNRQLGCAGELVLHPSNVAVVNAVYTPSAEDVAYYQGMVGAFERAAKEGKAAVVFEGEHIDLAHVETAREILAQAQAAKSKSKT